MWIRIGIKADPDPTFDLSADPDLGGQTNADAWDPDPEEILKSQKVEFLHKKYT